MISFLSNKAAFTSRLLAPTKFSIFSITKENFPGTIYPLSSSGKYYGGLF